MICPLLLQHWIKQMGVDRLPQKDQQPFYNVFVPDGSVRYAAQENIFPIQRAEARIDHAEIGKYFQVSVNVSSCDNLI